MKTITLTLTLEELKLLASLAEDQLFRKKFIDPKMPGYRADAGEMSLGNAIVGRLRLLLDQENPKRTPAVGAPGVTKAAGSNAI